MRLLPATLLLLQCLVGCASNDDAVADQWLGQWNAPEGTFLKVERQGSEYTLTIQNLDGPRTYIGSAEAGGIRFDRSGVTEHIRATNGVGTGMKWLSDKTECLTVRPGEGYCRD